MTVERRGQAIRVMIDLVNWKQEEPTGCGGGRQLSVDGTSRVTGDCDARFCERLGVKFPGATRRCRATGIPTATALPRQTLFQQPAIRAIPAVPSPRADSRSALRVLPRPAASPPSMS